ncbi:MAG: hypothetical protein ACOCUV_03235 [bacterium]
MKYTIGLFFIFIGIPSLFGQSNEEVLSQQIYEVAEKYISSSDLSRQNSSDPDCERFDPQIADDFVSLFGENIEVITVPDIFSMKLIQLYDTSLTKTSNKIAVSELYKSVNDYYMQSQRSDSLKAFTYSPKNPVIKLFTHEKKIKGNQYKSVIGFSYQVKVCLGQQMRHYRLPVIITLVYSIDESGNYSYPKIVKVEAREEPGGGEGLDFYVTPFAGISSGNMYFGSKKIEQYDNSSLANYGIGLLLQIKSPDLSKIISNSYIIGVGFRQINNLHSVSSLVLNTENELPPFEPSEGIVSSYSKEIRLSNIEEKTTFNMITVPVGIGLNYKFGGFSGKRSVYMNPMMVFGFPIKYNSMFNSGDVDYTGNFVIAGPTQSFPLTINDYYGFGQNFQTVSATNDYSYSKINISGEIELGYKYKLNNLSAFKVGLFYNHGFTKLFDNAEEIPEYITEWNGRIYSYPAFSSPVKQSLMGFRLSIQNFGFQIKRTVETISKK